MFSKSLSTALLKQMDEKEITQEQLAEMCHLSKRFVGDVVRGNAVPRLDTFEKICAGLEVSPDDLLIKDESREGDKAMPMCVDTLYHGAECGENVYIPICPSCNTLLHNDWQSYCDNCGQKLSWKKYISSKVIFEKPSK